MIEENKSNAVPGWSYCEYAIAYRKLENENTKLKDELARPITEHPDVQRLIGQVVELQAKNERLSKRDCNSTVQILLPTADSPFNKEDCRIVDVGYSDNIYVVECDAVVELQAENAKLKTAIRKHLKTDDVYWLEQALKGQTNE